MRGLLVVALWFVLVVSCVAQTEDPPVPDSELIFQTDNTQGHAITFEVVPLSVPVCMASGCTFQDTVAFLDSVRIVGDSRCADNAFDIRFCGEGSAPRSTTCSGVPVLVKALRHCFYRIDVKRDGELKKSVYYDNRDCKFPLGTCTNDHCTDNDISLRYYGSGDSVWSYNGFTDGGIDRDHPKWHLLSQGEIIKWWEYKQCWSRCFQPFWAIGLVVIPKTIGGSSVPYLVWGPYSAFQPSGYRIYRRLEPAIQFSLRATVAASVVSFQDNEIEVGAGSGGICPLLR